MTEITAVLLSIGEPTLARARASLEHQTLPVREVVLVENVSPFSKALNQAARQVRTPFFLQVDADMVLDPNCLETLFQGMSDDCALSVGHLRDPLLGKVVGVKLFRSQVVRDMPFPETVASDTDWLQQVTQAGWTHRYVTDESLEPCPTLGSHEPAYEDNYTFCKYARWAAAHLADAQFSGARWLVRTLLVSTHPSRWWALFGFAEGLARPAERDTLVPYGTHPKVEGMRGWLEHLAWDKVEAPPSESAEVSHELGYSLGCSGKTLGWEGPASWAGALGVALGLMDARFEETSQCRFPWSQLDRRPQPGTTARAPASRAARLRQQVISAYPRIVRALGRPHPLGLPAAPPRAGPLRRVGYVLWQAPGETCVQREIEALRRQGIEVLLFAQEGSSFEGCEVFAASPSSTRLDPGQALRALACLRLLLACNYSGQKDFYLDELMARQALWLADRARQLGVQVLHSPWAHPCALLAMLAARLANIACSAEVRAHEINRVLAPDLVPLLLRGLDGVVSNSQHTDRVLHSLVPQGLERRKRVYNMVPPQDFRGPGPRLDEACPRPLRILSVARLVDPKGLDTLLQACALLRQQQVPLLCTLVGGTEEPVFTASWIALRRLWQRLGLQDCVVFRGDLEFAEVAELYEQHHLLALPAQVAFDGSHDVDPSCILEAMARHLPVLATPIGAIGEQVEHDRSAWLVEPAHPQALAEGLLRLWRDPALRRRLAKEAFQRCQQLFSAERQGAALREFFQEIGRRSPGPGPRVEASLTAVTSASQLPAPTAATAATAPVATPGSLREQFYPWLVGRLPRFRLPARSAGPARSTARVGYLVWRWPPETFVQREIELLQERGLQVEVFAQESCPPGVSAWSRYWLLRHPWRWWQVVASVLSCRSHEHKSWRRDRRTLSEIFWLAGQVRSRRLDHLHSPWANPCALVVAAAARLAGCECSVKARAHELNRVTAPEFLPWLLPQVDRVATNSDWGLAQVRPWLKAGQPLRRIYNGVRLDDFPQQPRPQRPRPQPFHLLCVARLVDPKGLDTLLRACALLRQRGLDFQCRLIGGLEEPIYTYSWIELRRLRAHLGLEPWVELEGSRGWSDIQAAYAWADLLALPAHVDRYGAHDVTPNCIFEAMAAQLPVLACAVGGIAEQVEHGRSAWLVEPDQPEALARALEHLWGDVDLRSRLALQALKRCQSLFEGRRQAEEWLHFLT